MAIYLSVQFRIGDTQSSATTLQIVHNMNKFIRALINKKSFESFFSNSRMYQLPIKVHQQLAKESYDEFKAMYDTLPPNTLGKKQMKAQMTVYAGIYNRDYGQYKKGVDRFKKHGMANIQASHPLVTIISANKSRDINCATMDREYLPDFYERHLQYYNELYNDLPRGYFK